MLALGAACQPATEDSTTPDPWPEGCQEALVGEGELIESLELDFGEPATNAATLRWSTSNASTWEVLLDLGDGLWGMRISPAEEQAREHTALLAGLRVDSVYQYVLVGEVEGEPWCTRPATLETPRPPPALPVLTVSNLDPEQVAEGFFVVSLIMQSGAWPAILDSQGNLVWYYPAQMNHSYRAFLNHDRDAVLYMIDADTPEDEGSIQRVDLDGSQEISIPVAGCHQDFVEVEPGVYATLAWEIREFEHEGETRTLLGDLLVEVREGQEPVVIWNAFEHVDPNLAIRWPTIYAPDPDVEDWLHVNGMAFHEEQQAYYLSASNLEAIFKIDRASGELLWVLGGDGTTIPDSFSSPDDEPLLHGPHSIDLLDDGILVFNRGDVVIDGSAGDLGPYSEVAEIGIDESTMSASRRWDWGESQELHNNFLGDALRLPNGNTMVDWSSRGQLDQINVSEELVLTVNSDLGAAFGFIQHVDTLH